MSGGMTNLKNRRRGASRRRKTGKRDRKYLRKAPQREKRKNEGKTKGRDETIDSSNGKSPSSPSFSSSESEEDEFLPREVGGAEKLGLGPSNSEELREGI